jgi:hypothetical protein
MVFMVPECHRKTSRKVHPPWTLLEPLGMTIGSSILLLVPNPPGWGSGRVRVPSSLMAEI